METQSNYDKQGDGPLYTSQIVQDGKDDDTQSESSIGFHSDCSYSIEDDVSKTRLSSLPDFADIESNWIKKGNFHPGSSKKLELYTDENGKRRLVKSEDEGSDDKEDLLRILESLSRRHKNIVRFQLYRTQNPGQYCIVMPYFETTLTRMLESQGRNGLSLNFVKKAALQLLDAVSFVHIKGFAHLGVKKDNILLTLRGNVKLTDFDTCISLDSNNQGYFVSYKELERKCQQIYRPPEMERMKNRDSDKFDVRYVESWMCGIVIFEMLLGRTPHQSHKNERFDPANEDYQEANNIDMLLGNVIRKLLEKNLKIRYTPYFALKLLQGMEISDDSDIDEIGSRPNSVNSNGEQTGCCDISIISQPKICCTLS